jgi:hypothetical protein
MHINHSVKLNMSAHPKLVYGVALPLVAYVALTVIWLFPDLRALDSTQAFAIGKHLAVVLVITASLFFYLRVASWIALAWCAFVPLERYLALFQDIAAVSAGAAWSLERVDIVRVLLLLTAGLISGALVFNVHRRTPAPSVQTHA